MPAYDGTSFDPPAPVARLTVRNPETGASREHVPMLIDSGADITLIPASVVQHLALSLDPAIEYELQAFDGTVSRAALLYAVVVFCAHEFTGQFLVIDQEIGILGRNVLNLIPILLDGPNLTWDAVRRQPDA